MARKLLNRLELREENEAAEQLDHEEDQAVATEKAAKKPARRKSRAKLVKVVRLKAFWGVFNQSLRRIARFEYSDRQGADDRAKELSDAQKTPHFVQLVKEVLEE